jgi:signal transduction histidine kinase
MWKSRVVIMDKVTSAVTPPEQMTSDYVAAWKLALIYMVFGMLWILFSDRVVDMLVSGSADISLIQTYKGWFFILITGLLLCALCLRNFHTISEEAMNHEKAREDLETRTRFFAHMSHDIRTPVNAIVGMSELLADGQLNPEQKDQVRTIQSASNNLITLVNNLLDISRIEAGKLPLEHIAFDLKAVVGDCSDIIQPLAESKGLRFGVHFDTVAPRYLYGDPNRFSQILMNLLSNAVKFTAEGAVDIDLKLISQSANRCSIMVCVTDTGIGVSKCQQTQLFAEFAQADRSIARCYGGNGLGLSICRSLVLQMGGVVELESEPGKGSCFSMTIPFDIGDKEACQQSIPAKNPVATLKGFSPKRVLLAEDNPINQKTTIAVLNKLGMDVTVADNGEQAVNCFKAHDATKQIRNHAKGMHIPVIGLTGHSSSDHEKRAKDAGLSDHLVKPVRMTILQDAINKHA